MSPTARTLAMYRALGFFAEKVEQRLPIPGKFITRDMAGFADGIAWAPANGVIAWQATSGSNVAARLAKIRDLPAVRAWLEAPARIEILGWRKAGPRGKRKTWQVRRVLLGIADGRIVDAELEG